MSTTPTPTPTPPPSPTPGPDATPPVDGAPKPSLVGEPEPPKPGETPPEPPKPGEDKKPDAPTAFDSKALKLPDGFTPDEKLMGDFSSIMTDDKMSPQDRGQKLIDLYAGAVKAVGEANTKAWDDLNTKWQGEVKADTEIGGDKLPVTKSTIAKAIDSLGAEGATAFRQALDITGAGNNPAIVKGLFKMAKLLTEGGHVGGAPPSQPDVAKTFFPNSPEFHQKG